MFEKQSGKDEPKRWKTANVTKYLILSFVFIYSQRTGQNRGKWSDHKTHYKILEKKLCKNK